MGNQLKVGDVVVSKADTTKVYTILEINDNEAICIDGKNAKHTIPLIALMPKPSGGYRVSNI